MSENGNLAVANVAKKLADAEQAIDAALMRAAELAAELPRAWAMADVSVVVGQAAFDRAGELVATMTQARRHAGEAHKFLDVVRDKLGLPAVSWGDKMPLITETPVEDNVVKIAA